MAKAWDIRAYTHDGAIWCDDCVAAHFAEHGGSEEEWPPVFESDESPATGEYCDQCGAETAEPYDESTLTDVVHQWTLDSSQDEQAGDVSESFGWAALFLNVQRSELRDAGLWESYRDTRRGMMKTPEDSPSFIYFVDSYGFKNVDEYETEEDARKAWDELVAELEPNEGEDETEARDTETLDLFDVNP